MITAERNVKTTFDYVHKLKRIKFELIQTFEIGGYLKLKLIYL